MTVFELIKQLTRVPADTLVRINLPFEDSESEINGNSKEIELTEHMIEAYNKPYEGGSFNIDLRYI